MKPQSTNTNAESRGQNGGLSAARTERQKMRRVWSLKIAPGAQIRPRRRSEADSAERLCTRNNVRPNERLWQFVQEKELHLREELIPCTQHFFGLLHVWKPIHRPLSFLVQMRAVISSSGFQVAPRNVLLSYPIMKAVNGSRVGKAGFDMVIGKYEEPCRARFNHKGTPHNRKYPRVQAAAVMVLLASATHKTGRGPQLT